MKNVETLLQQFPTRRVEPYDGMVMTAEIWKEAQEFHRWRHRLHTLFANGPGIITGLQVIANSPSDTAVYILPGIAIDPSGQFVVLPAPTIYELGSNIGGALYLLLSCSQSDARTENGSQDAGDPKYVRSDYSISVETSLPPTPTVELARINRSSWDAVIRNARNYARPGANELDLRFRREVGAPPEITIAVSYLGTKVDKPQGEGMKNVTHSLNLTGKYRVSVEDDIKLHSEIDLRSYALIYFVAHGDALGIGREAQEKLRKYLYNDNGTLFIEVMDDTARDTVFGILEWMDVQPELLPDSHCLLSQPYPFAVPPAGFYLQEHPRIWVSEGIVLSTSKYGLLWRGQADDQTPSREQIRAALEWGSNLVAYAAERYRISGRRF